MKRFCVIGAIALASSLCVCLPAQEQQEHPSTHQMESELHRWDELKLDRRVPEFARGKQYAVNGEMKRAIAAFKHGARKRSSFGYFNVGLVYFHMQDYTMALGYFQRSERARHDALTRDYIAASTRLIKERLKMEKK